MRLRFAECDVMQGSKEMEAPDRVPECIFEESRSQSYQLIGCIIVHYPVLNENSRDSCPPSQHPFPSFLQIDSA